MHNDAKSIRRKRRRMRKTVVCKEAGFSIRTHGGGFIVQVRRQGLTESKTFATLEAAKLHCQMMNTKRTNEGTAAFSLNPVQRDDASHALAMLEGRASLVAAAKAWLRLNPANGGITFADLVPLLERTMASKGCRAGSIREVRTRCGHFAKDYGARVVGTITREEIEEWLSLRHPGRGFNNARLVLSAAFSFAVRKGFVETNPVSAIAAKKIDRGEPHFWEVGVVEDVMRAAAGLDGKRTAGARTTTAPLLPVLALSAFAGLRPAEAARLDWSSINLEESLIRVPASVSKVRRARLVPMPDNLVRWLLPYRAERGAVAPSPATVKRGQRKILTQAGLPLRWPHDVLRHSFATHWMAAHSHEGQLAEMLGNSPAIIQRHYKGLATAKEGAKYFKIEPQSFNNVIRLAVNA